MLILTNTTTSTSATEIVQHTTHQVPIPQKSLKSPAFEV